MRSSPAVKPMSASIQILVSMAAYLLPDVSQAQDPATQPLEEVVVTGSRIMRSGMSTPVPVTVMNTDELEALAPGQLIESLNQMPQFLNNVSPDSPSFYGSGAAGTSFLDMRGIGSNRTLVLLNGRRVVPSSKLGTVDINLFPEAMIQRMEIVTGGASAAYGSDAVTGVTNFILNTNFIGLEMQMQAGDTSRRDRQNEELQIAWGRDIGTRAHVQASFDFYHSESLFGYENREWFQDWALITNPDRSGPRRITVPNVGATVYTSGGLITGGPLAGVQFLADGTPAPFQRGSIVDRQTQSGGDGINVQRQNELYPEVYRRSAFLYGDYEIRASTRLFAQGIYGYNNVDYLVSELRQFAPFAPATIFLDNAFLPTSIRQAMTDAGVESFPFGRYSSFADWQDIEGVENTTTSVTLGFEHGLDNGWRLNGYYQTGLNQSDTRAFQARLDRAFRAMDSVIDARTGAIVCRSTLSNPNDGCVPANFFGQGQMSQEAKDYILATKIGYIDTEQDVAELSIDGEIFNGWGAGPILAASGISWREDSIEADYGPLEYKQLTIVPDEVVGYKGLPRNLDNNPDIFQHVEMLNVSGAYDVREVFAELNMPLLAEASMAEALSTTASVRYADYSGSGGVLAWKGGIDWDVTDSVRLRITRSRDTRAANLGERFDRQRIGAGIDDPWTGETNKPPLEGTIRGGNPEVAPELSDTLTYGIVYQPAWMEGLSLSVDRYSVEIEDAIARIGAQNIVDQCFSQGAFCNLLKQDSSTGEVLRVDDIMSNLERATVEGADMEALYRTALGGGENLSFRLLASYLGEHSFTNQFGNKLINDGEGTLPEWTGTASAMLSKGPFDLSLSARYIGSTKIELDWVEGVDVDDNTIDSRVYTNLQVGYEAEMGEGFWKLFANVQNLFDRAPPLAPSRNGLSTFGGAAHTNSLFDQLGRRYTLGVRVNY